MEIKLLALDLDGTALRSNNTLSPAVKSAITRAAASGVEVVVASGRPFCSMPREVLSIDGIRYVIASNGAAVYENGIRVHSVPMKEQDVAALLELTSEHELIWEAFTESGTFTDRRYYENPIKYGCGEAYVDYVRSSRGCCDNMREYIFRNKKALDSVELVSTDSGLRKAVWKRAEKEIGGLYITSSSKNFVEFMDKNATKSNGLKWICETLKTDIKNTAAAGNADNDVDMLTAAGLGVAVKNASALCLNAADWVVASNDDDGIAELIERLGIV